MSPKLYSKIPHTVTVGCCVGEMGWTRDRFKTS